MVKDFFINIIRTHQYRVLARGKYYIQRLLTLTAQWFNRKTRGRIDFIPNCNFRTSHSGSIQSSLQSNRLGMKSRLDTKYGRRNKHAW